MRRLLDLLVRVTLITLTIVLAMIVIYRFAFMPSYSIGYIAHAGGRAGGIEMTDSIAALDASYARGSRLFELDLMETADRHLVCGHDWKAAGGHLSFAEYLQWRQELSFPPCTGVELVDWFAAHSDAILVSDAKGDGRAINFGLAHVIPASLVVQAYSAREACRLHDAGIGKIILTMYRVPDSPVRLLRELSEPCLNDVPLQGLTMSWKRVLAGQALLAKWKSGLPVYAHTVDSCRAVRVLALLGADAVYSNDLQREDCTFWGLPRSAPGA